MEYLSTLGVFVSFYCVQVFSASLPSEMKGSLGGQVEEDVTMQLVMPNQIRTWKMFIALNTSILQCSWTMTVTKLCITKNQFFIDGMANASL